MDVTRPMHAAGQRHFDVGSPARTSDEHQVAAAFGNSGVGGQQIWKRRVDPGHRQERHVNWRQ